MMQLFLKLLWSMIRMGTTLTMFLWSVEVTAAVVLDPGQQQFHNMVSRRSILATSCSPLVVTMGVSVESASAANTVSSPSMTTSSVPTSSVVAPFTVITDPGTGYSALAYQPPIKNKSSTTTSTVQQSPKPLASSSLSSAATVPPTPSTPPPLLIFLHGAGKNQRDISNLVDPYGEHAGLLPSLLALSSSSSNDKGRQDETTTVPVELMTEFAILAPYSFQKRSFYEEPRSKLLQFIQWAVDGNTVAQQQQQQQQQQEGSFGDNNDNNKKKNDKSNCPLWFDPKRIILFGFSDGATLVIELLTTRRFQAGIICSYGFTGILPNLALQRLQGIPIWVFHSQDDQIFSVQYSDQLVQSLRQQVNTTTTTTTITTTTTSNIRYSRFDKDPENFSGSVRGHTTGITASKDPHVYQWLLSLPPLIS